MSASTYSVNSLLVGKVYYSNSKQLEGVIQEAVKRSDVYYPEADAYRIRVLADNGKEFWSTVGVSF